MSSIQLFEKPLGMRDSFPKLNQLKETIRSTGLSFFQTRGYESIKTPTLEYYETVGRASAIEDHALFKFVDRQGETLVLRPDMTTPIVRVATSKLLNEKNPLRLSYFANVFRAQQKEAGRPTEFEQMGIELIGDETIYADVEVVDTACVVLDQLGINDFQLTIGHAGLLFSILNDLTDTKEDAKKVQQLLFEKQRVEVFSFIQQMAIDESKKSELQNFITTATKLRNIEQLTAFMKSDNKEQQAFFHELIQFDSLLSEKVKSHVLYDLTMTSELQYYTGILFEIVAAGSGFVIGSGGRYDGLLEQFGTKTGATGFGLRVDRVMQALDATPSQTPATVIFFDGAHYSKACEKANLLRNRGELVTLQYISAVQNSQTFAQQFTHTIWMTEKDERNE